MNCIESPSMAPRRATDEEGVVAMRVSARVKGQHLGTRAPTRSRGHHAGSTSPRDVPGTAVRPPHSRRFVEWNDRRGLLLVAPRCSRRRAGQDESERRGVSNHVRTGGRSYSSSVANATRRRDGRITGAKGTDLRGSCAARGVSLNGMATSMCNNFGMAPSARSAR